MQVQIIVGFYKVQHNGISMLCPDFIGIIR